MTHALRWAACEGQSHKTVSTDTTFEEKGQPNRIRNEVPLLTSLTAKPNRLTVSIIG